jgi:hypothetical protein
MPRSIRLSGKPRAPPRARDEAVRDLVGRSAGAGRSAAGPVVAVTIYRSRLCPRLRSVRFATCQPAVEEIGSYDVTKDPAGIIIWGHPAMVCPLDRWLDDSTTRRSNVLRLTGADLFQGRPLGRRELQQPGPHLERYMPPPDDIPVHDRYHTRQASASIVDPSCRKQGNYDCEGKLAFLLHSAKKEVLGFRENRGAGVDIRTSGGLPLLGLRIHKLI